LVASSLSIILLQSLLSYLSCLLLSACHPVCTSFYYADCLSACYLVRLSTGLSVFLPVCRLLLSFCYSPSNLSCRLLSCLPVCMPTILLVCLSVMLLVCLSVVFFFLLICLPFCLSVVYSLACQYFCVSVFKLFSLSVCMSSCLFVCPPIILPVCLPVGLSNRTKPFYRNRNNSANSK
jgi:hypothetical protein